MMDSKAIKSFPEKKRSKLYLWWIQTSLCDWVSDTHWKFLGKPWFQFKRLCQWYWNVFRFDFDFDGHSLFGIIAYKLKRVEKSLANGCAIQEDKDMQALRLAIKLAGRLMADNYEEISYKKIHKKWGELKSWSEPIEGRTDVTRYRSKYENVKSEEDEKECRIDTKKAYESAYLKSKREERWLYGILQKYLRSWWD